MSGGATKAKVEVALARGQRADAAAASVLLALLETVAENFDGALAGEDPEYLHQLRIAVRRSRTVQRQLRDVFPPLELPGFRAELRWLQRATGAARDLDVQVEELASAQAGPELAPLRELLVELRAAARQAMERALRSRRTAELLEDWEALLGTLAELPTEDRPRAEAPVEQAVGRRVRRVYRQMRKMGRNLTPDSPPAEYHELRKKGKELRYLLELFGPSLFAGEAAEELVRSLKGLQDVLGRHQDREVQVALLRSVRSELATRPGGGAAVVAVDELAERLKADEAQARHQFAASFAEFTAPDRRRVVKESFR